MDLRIGAHMSIAGGYAKAAENSVSINANTFQFFTRNPRGGTMKALDGTDIAALTSIIKLNNFAPILAHAPYTINMASGKQETYTGAVELLKSDFAVMEELPSSLYNVHPGSHVGIGVEKGIENIVNAINTTLPEDPPFVLLLETMSGKGSEIGYRFEELAQIISSVKNPDYLGVCMDTCHMYCAGYDIVNSLDAVLNEFDKKVGLNRVKALHINDSMNPFASRKDRHSVIGSGAIGLDAIVKFISHPSLRGLPMFLETPHKDLSGYAEEIAMLRAKTENL